MVRDDGYVKVLDFGLARRLPTLSKADTAGAADTTPGALLGTVAYMSPEQARGEALGSASDVFSLGIVLYHLVTGKHPFESESPYATLHAIISQQPIPASRLNRETPAALDGLIEAMLHKDARLRPSAADVEAALEDLARQPKAPGQPAARTVVPREPEMEALRGALAAAEGGRSSLVCIAGEPGIGKTTLVEEFLKSAGEANPSALVGRGHCSERQAGTEAWLPVIDALDDLMRSDAAGSAARLIKAVAPSWYGEIAGDGRTGIQEPATGGQQAVAGDGPMLSGSRPGGTGAPAFSQQALLREFLNLMHAMSRLAPVVLFFDDVHWADLSTVDLLAYLGQHCAGLRLLIIATYRPTEMLLGPHAFHRVQLELQGKGTCRELPLSFLSRGDIDRYLAMTFPRHALPADFADLIHVRTEGSPLFMADLLRYLRERKVVAEVNGRWTLIQELPDLRQELPESVRSMIQRKLDQLSGHERKLLAAAAVQGHEFDSAMLAGALEDDPAEVEEQLQSLERVHGLVRLVRENVLPSGALTLRYVFVHILYQQALLASVPPTRRAALSLALARVLEEQQAPGKAAAAELACLYEVGRDFFRAAQQFHLAAQNAARVFAHREAVELARRGLGLLQGLRPRSARVDELELALQTTLGLQLQVTEGYGALSARQAYDRARALCPPTLDAPPHFPVLWGLWLCYKVASQLPRAQGFADELMTLARRLNDPDLALQAHQALGLTALCRGLPAETLEHVEQVATLYDRERHSHHAFQFGQDPGVIVKAYGGVALWLMGYPEAACRQCETAIAMSREMSPTSRSVAYHFAAMVYQLCGDIAKARHCADASAEISAEHGFSFWLAGGQIISGWALAVSGDAERGIAKLKQGLVDWQATNSVTYRTYFLALLADALAVAGKVEEAHRVLDEALALVEQTGEAFVLAELHRQRGELVLREDPVSEESSAQAREHFASALAVARRQQAKSLESRAAESLARLVS
jgi:predicted ATPase